MTTNINQIDFKKSLSGEEIAFLIGCSGDNSKALREMAGQKTIEIRGSKVWFRGLIELSNICIKDCFYCGIRKSNTKVPRYNLDDEAIIQAARYAFENRYGSVVLQSGERFDDEFIDRIDKLIKRIKEISDNKIGITLSLGEQTKETYQKWFNSGAHRYLLRVETTSKDLYQKLHPENELHSFERRLEALKALQEVGYQTGSGVMVGLPGQTISDLANDLLFLKEFDIDMVGMGPYIEHEDTPLAKSHQSPYTQEERLKMTLNMIATLRLMMPDINIAASTALQAIDPMGREKAIKCGANIIMPNITPAAERKNYQLYNNKPCIDESADDCLSCLQMRIAFTGRETGLGEWGDSLHFFKKQKNEQLKR
ncbi:[FeFe] hydrogenase H-cluster radical SAM maturase HydE [Natronoflexus pectinivorans]|uniref:Biotin synthase n=1 Tax=Natronoflexus pectinivorans TaxID=682526 RepID=A0A4R2GHN2_9BACT|nr:[FeFe] hydrogenase H-cluster radical SAM maturase HydE [Natronoflexus pectinivorans]TCO07310.1 biotin synthase [Natronoflexus pectinivorans]